MELHIKHQRGYLLIAGIVLIIVVSFAAVVLVKLLTSQSTATINTLQSKQALYIALSGLDIAKRDVVIKGTACNDLHLTHTNESLFNGQLSLTGVSHSASSTLAANIDSGSTSILLTDGSGFASEGMIKIGTEYIAYLNKSGNVLSEITRAKAGTVESNHNSTEAVEQDQCLLTSTGAVPTMASSTSSKRTVQSLILMGEVGVPFSFGGSVPSLGTTGDVSISGNGTLANPGITINGDGFEGSTIVSGGSVTITGNGETEVGGETSSDKDTFNDDIVQDYEFTEDIFETYFNGADEETVKSIAQNQGTYYTSYDYNTINGMTGKVIWIEDNVTLTGNDILSLGTATEPVVLVIDGDFSVSGNGNLNFYGLLFVKGNISMTGNSIFTGLGAIGATGDIHISGNGNKSLAYDEDVLDDAYATVPNIFSITEKIGLQEVFH